MKYYCHKCEKEMIWSGSYELEDGFEGIEEVYQCPDCPVDLTVTTYEEGTDEDLAKLFNEPIPNEDFDW